MMIDVYVSYFHNIHSFSSLYSSQLVIVQVVSIVDVSVVSTDNVNVQWPWEVVSVTCVPMDTLGHLTMAAWSV